MEILSNKLIAITGKPWIFAEDRLQVIKRSLMEVHEFIASTSMSLQKEEVTASWLKNHIEELRRMVGDLAEEANPL